MRARSRPPERTQFPHRCRWPRRTRGRRPPSRLRRRGALFLSTSLPFRIGPAYERPADAGLAETPVSNRRIKPYIGRYVKKKLSNTLYLAARVLFYTARPNLYDFQTAVGYNTTVQAGAAGPKFKRRFWPA